MMSLLSKTSSKEARESIVYLTTCGQALHQPVIESLDDEHTISRRRGVLYSRDKGSILMLPCHCAQVSSDEFALMGALMSTLFAASAVLGQPPVPRLTSVVFEKDDDANGHIDFITAASVCA